MKTLVLSFLFIGMLGESPRLIGAYKSSKNPRQFTISYKENGEYYKFTGSMREISELGIDTNEVNKWVAQSILNIKNIKKRQERYEEWGD